MIARIISLLAGDSASKIAGGAINGLSLFALAPVALWFLNNKDDILVTFTYSQAAVVGGLLFAFLKMAHYTKP